MPRLARTVDALGRRIEKVAGGTTRRYYMGKKWQVLAETNADGTTTKAWYIYGNYIDEVLRITNNTGTNDGDYYYLHDHLYSAVALLDDDGDVVERYEYDAYGKATIRNPQYAIRNTSLYGNSYLFTGRRLDILDGGSLKLQYNRNRYYDSETGRWLTHDPLGITPNPPKPNEFYVLGQYKDGMNLYEYGMSNPLHRRDGYGLKVCCYTKKDYTYQEPVWPHATGTVTRTKTVCGWEDIPNPHHCPPNLACCLHYRGREKTQVLDWYERPQGCCWCQVYRITIPLVAIRRRTIIPAHVSVGVKCDNGESWVADTGSDVKGWGVVCSKQPIDMADGWGTVAETFGQRVYGKVSCKRASEVKRQLESSDGWRYNFPFHDCRHFATSVQRRLTSKECQ